MKHPRNRGPILGLLAMFGAVSADGSLPKYRSHASSSRRAAPAGVQAELLAAAKAKRSRRAAKPGASKYARSNVR